MSSGKWRPSAPGLNVLILQPSRCKLIISYNYERYNRLLQLFIKVFILNDYYVINVLASFIFGTEKAVNVMILDTLNKILLNFPRNIIHVIILRLNIMV